ncbi:MAG: phosphoserine phosphatase SerB [Parvibaculaceae bacterium]
MPYVLNLIAAPGASAMNGDLVTEVKRRLGVPSAPIEWLSADEACDIVLPFDAGWDAIVAREIARAELKARGIDVNALLGEGRRRKLLIADMDSTVIEQECIDELAEVAGFGDRIRDITARAMRGEIDFVPALKERVRLLEGLAVDVIGKVIAERITLRSGGRTLVATMRANGAFTALVSGGFSAFTAHVAETVGFELHRANELLLRGGKLTGDVAEPVLGKDAKVEALDTLCRERGIGLEEVIAVGDGANDIPMLRRAGLGVALHGKPAVREAAACVIDHADLTALLYLQGYRREEFVEG